MISELNINNLAIIDTMNATVVGAQYQRPEEITTKNFADLLRKNDYRKIHQDVDTFLTCIVYLDETPMPNSGTGFYTHKETGWDGGTKKPDSIEVLIGSDFKRTSVIENKFNRMIMYNGNLVHRAEEAGNERLTLILGVYK